MNEHDSEKMMHLLRVDGFEHVENIKDADVVIVNTCCIREKAEQKFYSLMGRLRVTKRKNGTIIGITGCIAQMEKDAIWDKLPFIDFSLGPSNIHKIREAIANAAKKNIFCDFSENGHLASLFVKPENTGHKLKAYVTIMKGCNNFCSYCVVPYVRGKEVSRDSADILDEINNLALKGVREVVLLGQNVNSYNNNRNDLAFPDLLERIDVIEGIERIRFVTSHPKDLSDKLIDCFGRLKKLCEQIHLPFQSGSDKILKLMNRGYTINEYTEKVERLRKRCSGIAITADCIVGFPGEDEDDFEKTMNLVRSIGFDGLFSFVYSQRKATKAAYLPGEVPKDVALERLKRLQTVQKSITLNKNKEMEGSVVEVLIDGISKNSKDEMTGRTRTNKIVNFKGAGNIIGEMVDVEIIKGYANSLKGESFRPKEARYA